MYEVPRKKVEAYYSARVGYPLGAVRPGEVRVGVYGAATSNIASIRTARSVAYQPFATVFEVHSA